jgi:diguanylate cyclase (GGDEF)-like protein
MLEPNISEYTPDTQMSFYRLWCWYRYSEDSEEYIDYATEMLEQAKQKEDQAAQADFLNCRGFYYYYIDLFDEAFEDLDAALAIAQRLDNSLLIADIYSTMGDVFSFQGYIAQALASYKASSQFYHAANNKYSANAINSNIAITLRRMGDYDEAERYFKGQVVHYQSVGDVTSEADTAYEYGQLFLEKDDPNGAIVWFDSAINLIEKLLETEELDIEDRLDLYAYIGKAEALARLGQADEANYALAKSFEIDPEMAEEPYSPYISLILAQIQIAQGDYDSAAELAAESVEGYRELEDDMMLSYALQYLSEALALAGDYQAGYEAQLELALARQRNRERINENLSQRLKIEYNLAQKELENKELVFQNKAQQLELESKRRVEKWQWTALVLALLLLTTLASRLYVYFHRSHQLRSLALTDSLTGLANRRAIEAFSEEQYDQAEFTKSSISFIAFDIDYFKRINDSYGHEEGDNAIIHITKLAKKCLRSNDILARYGGEEFLAILPGADISQAGLIAQRICQTIAESPLIIKGKNIYLTVSIGVTMKSESDKNPGTTIRRADAALYDAKNSGRNQVVIVPPR